METAAVIPDTPPPMTSAEGSTSTFSSTCAWSNRDLATPIRMRSLAFFVAFSFSFMCTHEQCSRMLTNVNRYLLRPADSQVAWNIGACVLGVQLATTTRLRLCFLIPSLIELRPSSAQVYRLSMAYTTSGSVSAYFATDG